MGVNHTLFKFPGIPNIYCLFQGIPKPEEGNSLGFGNSEESAGLIQDLLAEFSGKGLKTISACHQVHGTEILVNPPEWGKHASIEKADGMCTATAGAGLLIKTADCQPVLLTDKSGSVIMALHVGWRGNRANFPGKALKIFARQYNLSPKDIFAVRGPSLCPECAEFINFESEWGEEFRFCFDDKTRRMDLWTLTKAQLQTEGVPENQIYGVDVCTAENPTNFFSYRKNRDKGRQGSLVWIGTGR